MNGWETQIAHVAQTQDGGWKERPLPDHSLPAVTVHNRHLGTHRARTPVYSFERLGPHPAPPPRGRQEIRAGGQVVRATHCPSLNHGQPEPAIAGVSSERLAPCFGSRVVASLGCRRRDGEEPPPPEPDSTSSSHSHEMWIESTKIGWPGACTQLSTAARHDTDEGDTAPGGLPACELLSP